MPLPTGFLIHPDSALHDPGWNNPEHQGRLRALASAVAKDLPALHDRVVQVEPRAATRKELLLVHGRPYLREMVHVVDSAREMGGLVALGEPDTIASPATCAAAVGSAGAAVVACEGVVEGRFRNAFAACRPPGHHAFPDRATGFCFINSVAVAARWLQSRKHAGKVLIVDWDIHHGNGTQEIFYRDPSVFFLSIHQSPHYPGTGGADECGEGEGEGTTLNVPIPAGMPRKEYLAHFREALDRALGVFAPDFILVSCGLDILAGDPLGGQLLEMEDVHRMTLDVMARAEAFCGGRLVLVLEGGYNAARTGDGSVSVLRALCGLDPAPEGR